jgi:Family of unknown function (DUF5694)
MTDSRLELWPRLLAISVAIPLGLAAQVEPRPEILIIGSYHMANRGHDIYNVHADDVLSAKRQQEIAHVIAVLKKFAPTKIAIETDVESQSVAKEYSDYLKGKYALSRDETNQIGYRLAKELGHEQVYPVNAWAGPDDFPIQRVINYAKANGRSTQLQTIMAKWGAATKELEDYLKTHTILETLEHANSDAFVTENVSPYFEIARFGDPLDYAGPDLLGSWYLRNIRIYHNIVKLIDSPKDRVLVVYGCGHLGWLRQNAQQDATVRLRTLAEFVP